MEHKLEKEGLQALIQVSQSVNSHLKLDDVLASVMRETTKALEAEAASLILVDETTGELVFHSVTGTKASTLRSFRLPSGTGIVGTVVDTNNPLIIKDAASDDRFYNKVDALTGFVTRSILCVPVSTGSKLWGAIEVLNRCDGEPFSEKDQVLCEAVAVQAAIAIENAMLHSSLLTNERFAAFGETVAGLAHCIRNVLTGMEGGRELVSRGLERDNLDMVSKGWNILDRNTDLIHDLVLDMLDYSQERRPDYQLVDINELVSATLDDFQRSRSTENIRFAWRPQDDTPFVVIDSHGIQRCVLNLLSNAVDAVKPALHPEIAVSVITNDEDKFSILVEDNGIGLPVDNPETLFKPFFTTKKSKGTGLGLSVTHKIVTEHGGKISVTPSAEKGCRFTIVLPRHGLEPNADYRLTVSSNPLESDRVTDTTISIAAEQLSAKLTAKSRVLIIDDDPDIQNILKFHLEQLRNISVSTASDGNEGLVLAHRLLPDLIILDLQMPFKDGFSTLGELRNSANTRAIPVIIITGIRSDRGNKLSTLEIKRTTGHEPTACLDKPIDPSVLRRTVLNILNEHPVNSGTDEQMKKSVAKQTRKG